MIKIIESSKNFVILYQNDCVECIRCFSYKKEIAYACYDKDKIYVHVKKNNIISDTNRQHYNHFIKNIKSIINNLKEIK